MRSPIAAALLALLLPALVSAAIADTASSPSVPLFVWSGYSATSVVAPASGQYLEPFSLREFDVCLSHLMGAFAPLVRCPLLRSAASASDAAGAQAELLVIALLPQLSPALLSRYSDAYATHPHGSFAHLQAALAAAKASVAVPYAALALAPGIVAATIEDTVRSQLASGAAVHVVGKPDGALALLGSGSAVAVADLAAHLDAHPSLFTNGVTDVLLLCADGPHSVDASDDVAAAFARADAELATVLALVDARSAGRYTVVYTAQESYVPPALQAAHDDAVHQRVMRDAAAADAAAGGGGNDPIPIPDPNPYMAYWPADIVGGVVSSLFLLIVLAGTLYLLAQVQTPEKFETPARKSQ